MGRKTVFSLAAFCLLISIAGTGVFSQAFGGEAWRLVGTWVEVSGVGDILVFYANGTTTGWGWSHWAAVDNTLVMTLAMEIGRAYEFRFSSDGNTLIIISLDAYGDGWIFRRN